jgi:hypothetical protein
LEHEREGLEATCSEENILLKGSGKFNQESKQKFENNKFERILFPQGHSNLPFESPQKVQ